MNKAIKKRALLIGSNGTIGAALAGQMRDQYQLYTLSRDDTDYSEASLEQISKHLLTEAPFSLIICCIGTLHNEQLAPEKALRQLNQATLSEYFRINTIIPALCVRFFHGYGYRSSKAALNQIVRTASIEVKRTNKMACLAAIHPGTTIGPLSKPFSSRISKDKYYTPEQSAERILHLSKGLQADQSGSFFNWDGSELSW